MFLLLIGVFFISVTGTQFVRLYLVKQGVIDIPNTRSSHLIPTPRGGGISIFVATSLSFLWLAHKGEFPMTTATVLLGGGTIIALLGLLDDHLQLPSWVRLLIHISVSTWAIVWIQGAGPLRIGSFTWQWGWIGSLIELIGLVWMINLYNFMDGIDGIAGTETICVCGLGGILLFGMGMQEYATGSWILATASAGFLVWNWPPAKIFMGDVGSSFLGYVLGVFVITSVKIHPNLLSSWIILLSIFLTDATTTLVRRILAGERWYEAHCSHAYQNASRLLGSHEKVTAGVGAINIAWLFPFAWISMRFPSIAPLCIVLAFVPLLHLAFRYKAGINQLTADQHKAVGSKPQVCQSLSDSL